VLIRVYPDNSAQVEPSESQPPELSGIMKVIVATADASLAANTYGKGFGLDVEPVVHDEGRGVLYARCRAPKGGVIELVSAVDRDKQFADDIERQVKEGNGGIYALVLHAGNPRAAAALLSSRGVSAEGETGRTVVAYGTRFIVE
jgi:hypothetical protein